MPLPKRPYNYELVEGVQVTKHPLYHTWHNMMNRCYSETDVGYTNYGGRGIEVCEKWWSFQGFFSDMGNKPTKLHTLDRIDNSKGYFPENCKWASRSEQCVNRRTFKNSTTGHEGVLLLKNGTYLVRFNYKNQRYTIGRFSNLDMAVARREEFKKLFFECRESALNLIPKETVWNTSGTGVRGISRHSDGGYMLRRTVNGKRIYMGYFKKLEDAINAKRRGDSKRTYKSKKRT